MKVLIADDDPVSRRNLQACLKRWGYDVLCAPDGTCAWKMLQAEPRIEMAVLDWMMPGLDGLELCRRIRSELYDRSVYVLLCTARDRAEDVIEGLDAGADDYVSKPARADELHARLRVGVRTVGLGNALRRRIAELNEAMAHVRQLQGLLPICMHCKRVRDDREIWHRIEIYLETHTDVEFSHGLCDACLEKHYPEAK